MSLPKSAFSSTKTKILKELWSIFAIYDAERSEPTEEPISYQEARCRHQYQGKRPSGLGTLRSCLFKTNELVVAACGVAGGCCFMRNYRVQAGPPERDNLTLPKNASWLRVASALPNRVVLRPFVIRFPLSRESFIKTFVDFHNSEQNHKHEDSD